MNKYQPKFYQTDLIFVDHGKNKKPRYELYDTFQNRGVYKSNNMKKIHKFFMKYWRELKKKEGALHV